MSQDPDSRRRDNIRQARQVLAGDAVRPSPDPWAAHSGAFPFSILQRNYLISLIVLLLLGALLIPIAGLGIASIAFFVLALGMIAGWLVF